MPTPNLTAAWSNAIALQAGDIVQNQTRDLIEVIVGDPATDAATLRLPAMTGAITVEKAVSIRARMVGRRKTGVLNIVRGF